MRKMRYRFSRLSTVREQKQNNQKTILFMLLTVVLIVLLVLYGIPLVTKIAGFAGSFNKKTNIAGDNIPPVAPNFFNLPVATNSADLTLNGNTEAGATVNVTLNDTDLTAVADDNGNFSLDLTLKNGTNTISATSKDTSGNVSKTSTNVTIAFSDKAPDLTITNPKDGANFSGDSQKTLNIQGTTTPGSSITINGRYVDVGADGSFSFNTTLSNGSNPFEVDSTDTFGNVTKKTLAVNFSS